MKIIMPIPAACLNPNAPNSKNYFAKSKARKAQRGDAMLMALRELNGGDAPKWERVRLTVRWFAAGEHRIPDIDNAIASCKGIFDGICDAGIIRNDRGIEGIDVWRVSDKARPRVEIEITKS